MLIDEVTPEWYYRLIELPQEGSFLLIRFH